MACFVIFRAKNICTLEVPMAKDDDFTCRPLDENDLCVEKSIALPVVLVLLLVSLPAIFFSTEMEAFLKGIVNPLNKALGSSFLWLVTIFVFMLIYFAISKHGDIKFGDPDEKPEFPLGSWAAMIFTSGVAGACMFWAIVEPSWYLVTPPMNAAPESVEAYNLSLSFLLLNWGPTAWSSYFICALPICYMFHIRRQPLLRVSAASEIVIGERKDKFLGRFLDCCFILGLMFCTTMTMCLSLPTVEATICKVTGFEPSLALQGKILLTTIAISAVSVYFGLKKGIKTVSDLNVLLAFALLIYVFLCGPTATLVDTFTNAVGRTANNFLTYILWTDPFTDQTVPQDWTMFYAMNWLGYGPFMGLFIARISRGRTVREIVGCGLFFAVLGGYCMHGVLGSYTLYLSHNNIIDVTGILVKQGGAALMAEVFDTLPFSTVVFIVYAMVSTIFLATSINSSCYIMAATATKRIGVNDDPNKYNLVMWALLQGLLAFGALTMGGLEVAKMLGKLAGIFICIPVILLAYAWIKMLKGDRLDEVTDCR